MTASTVLRITPIAPNTAFGLTPFSARNCTQTFPPWTGISGEDAFGSILQMSGNGKLLDLSHQQFQLYQTVIACTDSEPPQLDNGWYNALVQIDCVGELSYPVGGSPGRPMVNGTSPRTANGIVYYRPTLLMRISQVNPLVKEYGPRKYTWTLKAIETRAP